jgi:hypothetical protein
MASGERRKELRYVVDDVQIVIGGVRYPVIDIASSGARISCALRNFTSHTDDRCRIEFGADPVVSYEIDARLIRSTALYIVIGYDPPRADWEAFIRTYDTFHVHELDEQLFEA